MDEDYCTDCGKPRVIKAFFMCDECFTAWIVAAAARHVKGLQ